ncbi:hypothetical protein ACI4BE_29745, partial [Klebsiella pneumoniae]|uniref:hypothetical protein n=1 Tax=Klebsiella pneumoniae TaxID=573 RepID=UPI0038534E5D
VGLAGVHGFDRGGLDVRGRIEIGLAKAEVVNDNAFRFELPSLSPGGEGSGRSNRRTEWRK